MEHALAAIFAIGAVLAALCATLVIILVVRREPWRTVRNAYPTPRSLELFDKAYFCSASFNLTPYTWSLRFGEAQEGLHIAKLFWLGSFCVPWEQISIRESQQVKRRAVLLLMSMPEAELLFARCSSVQVRVSERLAARVATWRNRRCTGASHVIG
jgi:hypothetical protein